MLRTVHLYGSMAKRFGKRFQLHVASLKEVAQALGAQIPGFRQYLMDGHFRVTCGASKKEGLQLTRDDIAFSLPQGDIHIVPVVRGAGGGGGGRGQAIGKIIAGILIAVVAWYLLPVAWAGMGISLGISMALTGVSQLIAGKPKKPEDKKEDSFMFNGGLNVSEQGGPVALIYGRTMVGSTVISTGVTAVDYGVTGQVIFM